MPLSEKIILRLAQTVYSIDESIPSLESRFLSSTELEEILQLGNIKPSLNEKIANWFAEFLSLRASLWEVIEETHAEVKVGLNNLETYNDYRYFVIGFTAACSVVRLDRLLLEEFATENLIQRKLNEGFPEKNILRKQYTRIYNSFVDIDNAQRMLKVMNYASRERNKIKTLQNDSVVGGLVQNLWRFRGYLDPSKQNYFERARHFVKHALKRRGATIKQHTEFKVLEASGRIFSEMVNKKGKLVTAEIRTQAQKILQPGDILVTRHKYALTNFFLPGYWPHAALYVGTQSERDIGEIIFPLNIQKKLHGHESTFEALKDGVLFRPLENTLAVDAFVILRPTISQDGIKKALERIAVHEGKKYNFDFDFFRSDRLVCTELMYRAYDGIEHINIELQERAGRPTLSAEDLLDLSLETDMFEPIAIYGANKNYQLITESETVRELLQESYRN